MHRSRLRVFLRPTLTGGAVDVCLLFFGGMGTARRHAVGTEIECRSNVWRQVRRCGRFVPRHLLVGVTADDYDGSIGYFHGLRLA